MQNIRLACAINECCSEVPMLTKQFKLFCCYINCTIVHCLQSTISCSTVLSVEHYVFLYHQKHLNSSSLVTVYHYIAQHFLALFSVFPYKDKSGLVNFNNLTSKVYALIQIEPVSKHVYHGMSDIICAKTQNT